MGGNSTTLLSVSILPHMAFPFACLAPTVHLRTAKLNESYVRSMTVCVASLFTPTCPTPSGLRRSPQLPTLSTGALATPRHRSRRSSACSGHRLPTAISEHLAVSAIQTKLLQLRTSFQRALLHVSSWDIPVITVATGVWISTLVASSRLATFCSTNPCFLSEHHLLSQHCPCTVLHQTWMTNKCFPQTTILSVAGSFKQHLFATRHTSTPPLGLVLHRWLSFSR
jgi:hypothetical protein